MNTDIAARLASINSRLQGSFASLGVGSHNGTGPAVQSLYDRFLANGGEPLLSLPGMGSGTTSTGGSTTTSTGSGGSGDSGGSILDTVFGLSLSRVSAIILGFIFIAGAVYLFKPTQQIITSAAKTGASAARLIP